MWRPCWRGCQVSAPWGAAVGTGPSGHTLVQGGALRILAAHPHAWLRTLPSLCFKRFLLLLVSPLLKRTVININTFTWLPGFRSKAWFSYFSSCCFLGCLTHPPGGEPSPNSILRLHSPHSLPALDLPLPQPPPPTPMWLDLCLQACPPLGDEITLKTRDLGSTIHRAPTMYRAL